MGQAEENRQNNTARTGQREHDCQDRIAMTGLPALGGGGHYGTARKRQLGRNRKERDILNSTEQLGQDSQNETARMGEPEQGKPNRKD
jgi:hypothetical protein